MTQKELLLTDLCGRIPYHPKGLVVNACTGTECEEWLTCATFTMFTNVTNNCRLYLRPMSSMTEDERKEYELLANHCIVTSIGFIHLEAAPLIDWLNANHFDYRDLIEKGLALEAHKGMYKID